MKRILCLTLTRALAASASAGLFGPKSVSNAEKKTNIRQQRGEISRNFMPPTRT